MRPPSRVATVPLCKPYTLHFVKDGPAVPCRLFVVRDADEPMDQMWGASVDEITQPGTFTGGELETKLSGWIRAERVNPLEAVLFVRLMMHGKIISEERYASMMRNRNHWRKVAPWHPCLHHYEAMDLRKMPSLGHLTPPPGDEDV